MERRLIHRPITVEKRAEGEMPVIVGYGAVFHNPADPGTEYDMGWGFVERIAPGAFDRAIAEADDAAGLFNHDPNQVLGRVSSGTLKLSVDAVGLRYEITPPATQAARDLVEVLRRGDVAGSSFSFTVTDEEWAKESERDIRTIKGVRLYDTGPVTFPAYESTQAGVRADGEAAEALAAWRKKQAARAKGVAAAAKARATAVLAMLNAEG